MSPTDPLHERWEALQAPVCARFGAARWTPDLARDSGVSADVVGGRFAAEGRWPLHGLRHPPTETSTGWYLWAGALSDADDFFAPAHTLHLDTWCADAVPYLGLPPGWRFLLAPGHEDVWFDASLLDV